MKKCFVFNCLSLMFVVGLTTSCSSTDEDVFSVDTGLLQKGIATDLNGGYFDVDVKSNGSWTASVPDDCDWITVINEAGSGNASVNIFVDGNYTNDHRNTRLILTGGGDVFEIPITQNTDINGAPAENSDGTTFANLASTKGLGYGYRLEEYNSDGTLDEDNSFKAIQPIINLKALDVLKKADDLEYDGLSTYQTKNASNDEECNVDSIEVKSDELDIKLTFDIAYGLFKLKIKGEYIGSEERSTTDKTYRTSRNYPSFEGSIDYSSIAGYYSSYLNDTTKSWTEAEKKALKAIYTKGFRDKILALKECVGESDKSNYTTNKKLVTAVTALVDAYGPAVTTRATLGGKCSLEFCCDSAYTKEEMRIDSAQVAVSITSGLFSLDADVQATYGKSAETLLEKGYFKSVISGGTSEKRSALSKALSETDVRSINTAVKEWANLIVASDDTSKNTSEVLSVECVGIWQFIPDSKISEIVKEYVGERYPYLKSRLQIK